jgi:ribosomal protein S1
VEASNHLCTHFPLQVGDLILGTVKAIDISGVCVDLGDGVTGLLHDSDISMERVESVGNILHLDDKIKVGLTTEWRLVRFSKRTR